MAQRPRLLDVFEGKSNQKIILTASVLIVLALEILIYLAAASQSGQQSRVVITDGNGVKKYEAPGTALTSYEKLNFENNFGPLKDYRIQIHTEHLPFPFRAWSSAAVGIPIGLILIVAFVVRCYLALVYGEAQPGKGDGTGDMEIGRFGVMASLFQRVSVFQFGFLVLIGVLLFWIVPNFLGDFARVSISAIREFKWFFAGAALFLAGLILWVIHLRYKLSREMLKNQGELDKYRLQIRLLEQKEAPPLLPTSVDPPSGE
jgi:hypothetical protein